MKSKIYYYASTKRRIFKDFDSDDLEENYKLCIFNKARQLMSKTGSRPSVDMNGKYTLIEKYNNQFEGLCNPLYINCYIKKDGNAKFLRQIQIDNLYNYLLNDKDIVLERWYDFPMKNCDIIYKKFIEIANECDDNIKYDKFIDLVKSYPEQILMIKKLQKIMKNQPIYKFLDFLENIYNKDRNRLDYDKINECCIEYTLKSKVKKLVRGNE